MQNMNDLRALLERIDHKGYPAYKDTKGEYNFGSYILDIEHVQGDPFASPSNIKLIVGSKYAGIPSELYDEPHRRIASQDYLLRQFGARASKFSFQAKGSGKSGLIGISRCGQEVLDRSACQIDSKNGDVIIRLEVGFPANGRTINSRELIKILFDMLPRIVNDTLIYKNINAAEIKRCAELADNQTHIRNELKKRGLAAFVANNAVLPRESGISGRPMKTAVPFRAPQSMEVEILLPHGGPIKGMGIPKGVTLIVGGGYHGKSTLLKALEMGIYNHIEGDGREYVITDDAAVKIRAEDGRSIKQADISMFIRNLPNKLDTTSFYTQDASGSTSQAANVVEAVEAGASALLIDEDTSATNFMIRDELMQRVIKREQEPIIPYIDRIRELYENFGLSTILVAGSSGAYFDKSDKIIQMECYKAYDITEQAKAEAVKYSNHNGNNEELNKCEPAQRPTFMRKISPYKEWQDDRVKIKINGRDTILINKDAVDTRYVEQLADSEQLRTIGYMLRCLNDRFFNSKLTLTETIEALWREIDKKGFSAVCEGRIIPGNLAMPRKQELYACVNRCRQIKL